MKRFTETGKWLDPWFRKLSPTAKLLWIYLLDHCDNAGVIEIDLELASILIGQTANQEHLTELSDRLKSLEGKKTLIPKFIRFQFGELSTLSRVHQSVFALLERHNLRYPMDSLSIGYVKGTGTLKDKEKVQDKEKDRGVQGGNGAPPRFQKPTLAMMRLQAAKIGLPDTEAEKCFYYYESNGWRVGRNAMKSWPGAMQTWKRNWEDRRTTGTATSASVALVRDQAALKRVEDRLAYIKGQFPLPADSSLRVELNQLKTERTKLMSAIGFKA